MPYKSMLPQLSVASLLKGIRTPNESVLDAREQTRREVDDDKRSRIVRVLSSGMILLGAMDLTATPIVKRIAGFCKFYLHTHKYTHTHARLHPHSHT